MLHFRLSTMQAYTNSYIKEMATRNPSIEQRVRVVAMRKFNRYNSIVTAVVLGMTISGGSRALGWAAQSLRRWGCGGGQIGTVQALSLMCACCVCTAQAWFAST